MALGIGVTAWFLATAAFGRSLASFDPSADSDDGHEVPLLTPHRE